MVTASMPSGHTMIANSRDAIMGDYRKLEVWSLACGLADRIHVMVDCLPPRERKNMGEQLLRAADSIHMNISEGCGLNSDPQLAKHVRIALGSANEVEDGIERLGHRRTLPASHHDLLADATVLRRKLGAFLKRIDGD
jgi:four helix bundle protein